MLLFFQKPMAAIPQIRYNNPKMLRSGMPTSQVAIGPYHIDPFLAKASLQTPKIDVRAEPSRMEKLAIGLYWHSYPTSQAVALKSQYVFV